MHGTRRGATAALAAAAAGAAALLYLLGRGEIFFFDEWNLVLDRRAWTADAFLTPHNEHLSLVPVAVYKVLFVVVGLREYGAYRAVLIVFHLACVALLYVLARRRVGPWLALAPAVVLLLLGRGYPVLLWPIHIGYLGSLVGGLGMLGALDREGRRADLAAAGCLALALASSSFGLPVAAAAAVELAWHDRRRLWIVAGPLVLYVVWFAVYGTTGDAPVGENLRRLPRYVVELAATAAGGVSGLGRWAGAVLVVVGIAAAAWRVRRPSPRLAGLTVALLVFWILAAVERAQLVPATDPKFVYPSCVFLLLILVELARGVAPGRRAWAVVAAATAVALAGNLVALVHGADRLRRVEGRTAAELGALELARGHVARDFRPDPTEMPQVAAGPYLAAVDALGSPADTPTRLVARPADVRADADAVLVRALRLRLAAAPSSVRATSPPRVEATSRGTVARAGGCVRFRPLRPGAYVDLTVPVGGLVLERAEAPAAVRVRRFGDGFPYAVVGTLHAGDRTVLSPPRDAAPQPWHARVSTPAPVTACAV